MQQQKKILDIGCGRKPRGNINIDKRDLSNKVENFIQMDIEKEPLPFENETIDIIYCYDTLEHLIYPEELMKEMVRVLKKEGKVFIRVPNVLASMAHNDPTHIFFFDKNRINYLAKSFFRKVSIAGEGLHYATGFKPFDFFLKQICFFSENFVLKCSKPYPYEKVKNFPKFKRWYFENEK